MDNLLQISIYFCFIFLQSFSEMFLIIRNRLHIHELLFNSKNFDPEF